tara:strand:- start:176 stop:505 length:330 start_codon:yes stop_codon:yes gene_type:complete
MVARLRHFILSIVLLCSTWFFGMLVRRYGFIDAKHTCTNEEGKDSIRQPLSVILFQPILVPICLLLQLDNVQPLRTPLFDPDLHRAISVYNVDVDVGRATWRKDGRGKQ